MKVSEIFGQLLENLKVGDASTTIAMRRDEIIKALNKDFRSIEGSTAHRLMVGSYGRHTAIRSVSDLDLIFISLVVCARAMTTRTDHGEF